MKTKSTELLRWMVSMTTFSTHEVLQAGLDLFYNRADRTKRDFVEQGLIRKLSDFEKVHHGYTCKDDVFMTIPKEIEAYLNPKLF